MLDIKSLTRKRDLLEPNEPGFGIHNRRDETIVGMKVEIGGGDACDKLYSCTFKDCEIRLRAPGPLIGAATRGQVFEDCHIWAAQKQSIATWEATFLRCRFRGTFAARFSGPVKDCDFTNATLLSATFLQSEPLGDIKWPTWPHVIIDSPTDNHQEWKTFPNHPTSIGSLSGRLGQLQ